MENKSVTDDVQNNSGTKNTTSSSEIKGEELNQTQNKYDSRSEEKPKQKTIVATDAKPDRVSHDNRDTTSRGESAQDDDDLEDENKDDDFDEEIPKPDEEEVPLLPRSNNPSFPSIS